MKKILVVEDDRKHADDAEDMAKSMGIRVENTCEVALHAKRTMDNANGNGKGVWRVDGMVIDLFFPYTYEDGPQRGVPIPSPEGQPIGILVAA